MWSEQASDILSEMLASSTSCYSQPRAVHEDAADTPADQVLEGIGHSKEDN